MASQGPFWHHLCLFVFVDLSLSRPLQPFLHTLSVPGTIPDPLPPPPPNDPTPPSPPLRHPRRRLQVVRTALVAALQRLDAEPGRHGAWPREPSPELEAEALQRHAGYVTQAALLLAAQGPAQLPDTPSALTWAREQEQQHLGDIHAAAARYKTQLSECVAGRGDAATVAGVRADVRDFAAAAAKRGAVCADDLAAAQWAADVQCVDALRSEIAALLPGTDAAPLCARLRTALDALVARNLPAHIRTPVEVNALAQHCSNALLRPMLAAARQLAPHARAGTRFPLGPHGSESPAQALGLILDNSWQLADCVHRMHDCCADLETDPRALERQMQVLHTTLRRRQGSGDRPRLGMRHFDRA